MSKAPIAPDGISATRVRETVARYMLADGYELVLDLESSRGRAAMLPECLSGEVRAMIGAPRRPIQPMAIDPRTPAWVATMPPTNALSGVTARLTHRCAAVMRERRPSGEAFCRSVREVTE